jgi:hypothetical protein
MKDSMEQDQRITKELGRYRLASPSPGLHERVLLAAREAWTNSESGLRWTDRWMRACGEFRQEILAIASAFMLILGVVLQLGGSQSALADSVERLTVMAAVSGSLHRATTMDCIVTKPGAADERVQYRLRWNAAGVTRVEMTSARGTGQTLWISNGTVTAVDDEGGTLHSTSTTDMPSRWKAPLEFQTPATIAQHLKRFGLRQADDQGSAQPGELVLVGQENQQVVEIAINSRTALPTALKKFPPAQGGTGKGLAGFEEVRFQWNKAIPQELFIPDLSTIRKQVH